MTSKTIDGVSRKLLEQLVDPVNHIGRVRARAELRALLDSPVIAICRGCFTEQPMGKACNTCAEVEAQRAAQPQGEPVAQGVGVLTFMRSTSEGASRCACCEGDHVFCRYFKGLPDFNDLTQGLRHRNDLEGREFRVTVEALPLYAQPPAPLACPGDGVGPCKKCRCEQASQ